MGVTKLACKGTRSSAQVMQLPPPPPWNFQYILVKWLILPQNWRMPLPLPRLPPPPWVLPQTTALPVVGSNRGQVGYFSSRLCIYTLFQTAQRHGVCSAVYGTVHCKEPLLSMVLCTVKNQCCLWYNAL